MATFDITNFCNFECVHCCRANDRTRDLPVNAWIAILRQYLAHPVRIVFAGGEPLLCPTLLPLMQMVRTVSPKDDDAWERLLEGPATPEELFRLVGRNRLVVTTNGHLLDVHADMLERMGAVVWLSLDAATKDVFERVRRKSDHDRILRNLDRLRGRVPVHVNSVVMHDTAAEASLLIADMDARGIAFVRFTPVHQVGSARRHGIKVFHQSYVACIEDALDYFEQRQSSMLVLFNLTQTQQVFLRHHGLYEALMTRVAASRNVYVAEKSCEFNELDRSVVNPKGKYTGCCNASSLPAFAMGDMLVDGLDASRANENVAAIFRTVPRLCRTCDYLDVCGGGCRLTSYEAFGDPLVLDPTCPFLDSRLEAGTLPS
jgi:radical SAM protein with 4Fe4S-binding SPASM domain